MYYHHHKLLAQSVHKHLRLIHMLSFDRSIKEIWLFILFIFHYLSLQSYLSEMCGIVVFCTTSFKQELFLSLSKGTILELHFKFPFYTMRCISLTCCYQIFCKLMGYIIYKIYVKVRLLLDYWFITCIERICLLHERSLIYRKETQLFLFQSPAVLHIPALYLPTKYNEGLIIKE